MANEQTPSAYTSEQYQQLLERLLTVQTRTIECHTLDNQEKVWVRRADSHNAIWPYYLLGFITKLLGADALKPVPSLGGTVAIKNEAAALKRFAEHGILAPTLLAQTEQALMMSNLSDIDNLMKALLKAQQAQDNQLLMKRWEQGVIAIAEVHDKGQHLSQCFARNMMVCPNDKIGFIDFEDEPSKVLTLSQCQTRDWLCYLHSTAFLLDDDKHREQGIAILKKALGEKAQNTIAKIEKNTKYLGWLRHLTHKRWGRDTLRVAALMRLISLANATSNTRH